MVNAWSMLPHYSEQSRIWDTYIGWYYECPAVSQTTLMNEVNCFFFFPILLRYKPFSKKLLDATLNEGRSMAL